MPTRVTVPPIPNPTEVLAEQDVHGQSDNLYDIEILKMVAPDYPDGVAEKTIQDALDGDFFPDVLTVPCEQVEPLITQEQKAELKAVLDETTDANAAQQVDNVEMPRPDKSVRSAPIVREAFASLSDPRLAVFDDAVDHCMLRISNEPHQNPSFTAATMAILPSLFGTMLLGLRQASKEFMGFTYEDASMIWETEYRGT